MAGLFLVADVICRRFLMPYSRHLSIPKYRIVAGTRTEDGQRREGWLVERVSGPYCTHISALFPRKVDAEKELERIRAIPEIAPDLGRQYH